MQVELIFIINLLNKDSRKSSKKLRYVGGEVTYNTQRVSALAQVQILFVFRKLSLNWCSEAMIYAQVPCEKLSTFDLA